MVRGLSVFAAILALSAPGGATVLSVRVVESGGRPVHDGAVTLHPSADMHAARPTCHYIWDAYLRAPGVAMQSAIARSQRSASFSVRLRAPPPQMPMDY